MSDKPELPIHNTPSPNYIRLVYQDYVNIEQFLPDPGYLDSGWDDLTDEEKVSCQRVRAIIKLQKDKFAKRA